MKRLRYCGRHITRWDDRLILRSVIFCFLGFAIMGIKLAIKQETRLAMSENVVMNQIATGVLFALMLTASFFALLTKTGIYYDMENRQALARMLIENGWYESAAGKSRRDRTGITYFPKICYRKSRGRVYVAVKINMGKYQEHLLALEGKIETGLNCELICKEYRDRWEYYTFLCKVEKNRIRIDEVAAEGGRLKLMKHITWDYDRYPHMLIAGVTGGGKTSFLLAIVEALLDAGADMYIADAKNADLAGLETILPNVYYTKEGIAECIAGFYEAMVARNDEMKQRPDYMPGKNYAAYGYAASFLVFDEYVAYMEMLQKKEWEEITSLIKKIILLGRQAGFFLVLACQRPDAKYLGDGIRDQFGFRAALGAMSMSGYRMMFGDTEKAFFSKDIKGRGYVNTGSDVVTEFYTPYVSPEHDFFASIKAIQESRKNVIEKEDD